MKAEARREPGSGYGPGVCSGGNSGVRRGRITNAQEVDLLRRERARMQDKKLMPTFVVWAAK